MKYLIPHILILFLHTQLHSSEYIQKQTSSIISISAAISVGALATYYYWSLSSQMDTIMQQQEKHVQKLQAVTASLFELQKSYELICHDKKQGTLLQALHACQNEIKHVAADVAALKQGKGIERRSLFRSSSLKTGKE